MKVDRLMPADHARWDAFVQACPEATFFHRAGWRTVLEGTFGHRGHFLFAHRDGAIEGVLPLAEVSSRLFGRSLTSLPFTVYGGIAAASEAARQALDTAAQALAAELGVGHLEYRNVRPFHGDWPRSDLYVTFRKTLDDDEERNMLAIPRKQRAMVRKGVKSGLASSIDEGVDRFYPLFARSVHRLGTPALPRAYFVRLLEVFGRDCEILTVTKDGEAMGAVFTFLFRDEVLPYYAGEAPAGRALAASDFKYWEVMRRACTRGARVFDFGRSKRGTGSFDFKKNWGFEPQPLSYEYKLVKATKVPNNNPLNPRFRLASAAWRRLPLPVATWLGPHFVKNLG